MILISLQFLAICVYGLAVCILAVYALHAGLLTIMALRYISPAQAENRLTIDDWPDVTVQIPMRNERYVVQRILEQSAALDYPYDKLHIQVLDDSSDDTTLLAESCAKKIRASGIDITVIHRSQPHGYKAGALRNAMQYVQGEFIALFDADFLPEPDFLKRMVFALMEHPETGMVQARWTHMNTTQNVFTRIQSLALDAHFLIDHPARNLSGLLMNFNGAAGVWRLQAIIDADGWSADTLTEDLDLSYRAQLQGWRMKYLPDVPVGEELPPFYDAVKAQQKRWAKGAAQCLRKLARPILTSKVISSRQKLYALLHLSGYFSQMALLMTLIISLPLTLFARAELPGYFGIVSLVATLTAAFYYVSSQLMPRVEGKSYRWGNLLHYPVLLAMGLCTSLNISLALLDGLHNPGGEFVRTAKYNLADQQVAPAAYVDSSTRHTHITEWISLGYAGIVLTTAILTGNLQFTYISIAYIAAVTLIGVLDIISRKRFFAQRKTGGV